ncbi:MAG: SLBB domain-containing protein [Xenococcaceae cyanobacterium]
MVFKSIFSQFLTGRGRQVSTVASLFLLTVHPLSLPALAQQRTLEPPYSPVSGFNPLPIETDYILGGGDILRIDIFQLEELSGEFLVLVDGTVNLPLIGRVRVGGLSLPEMNELVSQQYARFLKRPIITVSVITPRPLKIAISGEINSPGTYTVTFEEGSTFPSVTNMLQLAGGITTAADIGKVQIRRFFQGKERVLTLNLWELLQQGNLNQDVTLRDGDTIFVPTKDEIDMAETRQLADASFGIQANQILNVTVIGEVGRPGSYALAPEEGETLEPPRLTGAIKEAGGIRSLADIRRIEVRRSTRSGAQQTIDVDLWQLLQTGDINEDVILQEGDTIVIPKAKELTPNEAEVLASASFAPDTIQVNVIGAVETPGIVEVPPNTPLNQALLAAGGFNSRASKSFVELVRLNPNGTVSKRKIRVKFSQDINEENNPILRNNDVVMVNTSTLAKVGDTLSEFVVPLGGIALFIGLFTGDTANNN